MNFFLLLDFVTSAMCTVNVIMLNLTTLKRQIPIPSTDPLDKPKLPRSKVSSLMPGFLSSFTIVVWFIAV